MYLFQRKHKRVHACSAPSFTFHYVSISTVKWLLILDNERIYIPLCIYFNTEYSKTGSQRKDIYIPLCIYFNRVIRNGSVTGTKFTFHYVSISTNNVIITYGNINKNLHSTMYLFQRLRSGHS